MDLLPSPSGAGKGESRLRDLICNSLPPSKTLSPTLSQREGARHKTTKMLFPIADDNSDRRTTPVVNYVLILLNILVFVFLQGFGNNEKFTYAFSTVPAEIIN